MIDIILLIWLHFFADFILQSDKIAINKSKDNAILTLHVVLYMIPFFFYGWLFAVVNGILHFITDYYTSRLAGKLWEKGERHWFFVTIGFDQALHLTALLLTYSLLIGF